MQTSSDPKQAFKSLAEAGMPVGEVVAVIGFLVTVKGLQPINQQAMVLFADGSKGYVRHIMEDTVEVLHLGSSAVQTGMLVVAQGSDLAANVGREFIGRVVSVSGAPLDDKGPISADKQWPIFNQAPPIHERQALDTQLETGVTLIDTLFPIVRGQRMALIGDSKAGKSVLATQIAINQQNTDQVVVYVLIAKHRSEIDALLTRLTATGALAKTIVIVANIFDSLITSYLAPYVGCAMAEYLWQELGQDVVVIYDDLTTHAYTCREIALLSGTNPGRDSYPGDIFHTHSSLLERAGKLAKNSKSLTAIPLVLADGGDITGYLPTNIMSITDGQWILDMDLFRSGLRPAISIGLSVTRVGGRGQNERQRRQNERIFKIMSDYEEARQFSHFGAEISAPVQLALRAGWRLRAFFTQGPNEVVSPITQQLVLDTLLDDNHPEIDVDSLKTAAAEASKLIKNNSDYDAKLAQLKLKFTTAPQPQTSR